jgi:succinoglycan biosynthesis protein ExoA
LISAIVAVRTLDCEESVIQNLSAYPFDEIILAQGANPSIQRNDAAAAARGDILYFFDDDSVLASGSVEAVIADLDADLSAAVAGGPALTKKTDSPLQKVFASVLASPWATAKSSARYHKTGKKRYTTEAELILCNMAIRKKVFLELEGFREDLYPNEENEFLDRVASAGHKMIYDPDVFIVRSARKSFPLFVKQCFNYGSGRSEQVVVRPKKQDLPNFIPALFLFYILMLILSGGGVIASAPMIAYTLLTAVFAGELSRKLGDIKLLPVMALSFFTLHVCYGAGSVYGLVKGIMGRSKAPERAVELKIIGGKK